MQEYRITEYLGKDDKGNDKFVITVPPKEKWDLNPSPERISIAHDYVEFHGGSHFMLENNIVKPESQQVGASNWLVSKASIQISIREMFALILPMLNQHKYLQPEHFEDRVQSEDDEYFEKLGLSKPRYKKGDKYPAYAYEGAIVHYYDEVNKIRMVAFRRTGEANYNHVSSDVFDMVKSTLRLSYSKEEAKKMQLTKD